MVIFLLTECPSGKHWGTAEFKSVFPINLTAAVPSPAKRSFSQNASFAIRREMSVQISPLFFVCVFPSHKLEILKCQISRSGDDSIPVPHVIFFTLGKLVRKK